MTSNNDRADIAISQWKACKPDLETFPMEVLGRLLEASELLFRKKLTPLFREHGLQLGEFDVLATLYRSNRPDISPTDLFKTMMISSAGMTGRLHRLTQAGLIERTQNPSDKRGHYVVLTDKGRSLMEEIIPKHVANQKNIISCISKDDAMTLNRILREVIASWDSNES